MKPLFLFCSLFIFLFSGTAQQDSTDKSKVQFKLGVNYNSNLHYYGRTDSLNSSGIYPMAELWVNDSWYVNAAPIFVHNKVVGADYAGTVTTLGYLHVSKKWITHLYALKPFYTAESALVQSALKGQAGASVTALSKVVNLSVGGDVKYSNVFDFGAQASLDHIVRMEHGKNIFILDPTVSVNAGTQRFLQTHRQKKGVLFPREEVVTQEKLAFRVLAYEMSLPFIYVRNGIQFMATPAYVAPQNLLPGENGKPLAYITLGVKYSF